MGTSERVSACGAPPDVRLLAATCPPLGSFLRLWASSCSMSLVRVPGLLAALSFFGKLGFSSVSP
eukprot:14773195-Alexandrium_andersonii.AAC.1